MPFVEKGTTFQVTSPQEHCISVLKPRNKVNDVYQLTKLDDIAVRCFINLSPF